MENEKQSVHTGEPAELSKEERIEAYFTSDNEHLNKYTFKIYTSVTESGLFKDVEVPLNAFTNAEGFLHINRDKPLSVVKALMNYFEEQDPPFINEQKRFVLDQLIWYYNTTVFTSPDKQEYTLDRVTKLLQQEADKLTEPIEVNAQRYDWNATKAHLTTLPDTSAKIAYLLEQQASYKQTQAGQLDWGLGPKFDKQCQTEIKKLRDLVELEQQGQVMKSPFKISDKKGAKINLIRVLNALYELRLIELENGHLPNKEQFMQLIGDSLGVDLRAYQNDLKQAFKQSIEINSKIFEDLKSVTITDWQSRQDRDL